MALSYSQISTYRRCPKQYEFAHVERIPRALSDGESFGSSIHNALKRWGELEEKHASPPPIQQLSLFAGHAITPTLPPLTLQTLTTMLRACFIAEGYADVAAMDAALKRGEKLLAAYMSWWASRSRTILAVEKSFRLSLTLGKATLDVTGRFDRVERDGEGIVIYDYKTGPVRSQESLDADLQLSLYAMACEKIWNVIPELALLFLHEDGITEMRTKRTTAALIEAQKSIGAVATAIDQKIFPAHPEEKRCAVCPYRDRCPARFGA